MNRDTFVPKSCLPGIEWPAVPRPQDAQLLALLAQFEQTQWWSANQLREAQLRQATHLILHAASSVPFYRERLKAFAGFTRPLTMDEFRQIPELTKHDVQSQYDELTCRSLPPGHSPTFEVTTSGSSGTPTRILTTPVTQILFSVFTLRAAVWNRRDPTQPNMSVRLVRGKRPKIEEGHGWLRGYPPGPAFRYCSTLSLEQIYAGLVQHEPVYLQAYPATVELLVRQSIADGYRPPRLREIRTFGGPVTSPLRELARKTWGVSIADNYSAVETGVIALQCSDTENLHVQSENVLLEVLDNSGRPCGPGETGRAVVTVLNNFATPLIRYDLGDFLEVADACHCGRGLPALKRVVGRDVNHFTLPDGSRILPHVGSQRLAEIAGVRQYQLVQKTLADVHLNLVMDQPLTPELETRMREHLGKAVSPQFNYIFHRVEEVRRGPTGKYETVWSEISTR